MKKSIKLIPALACLAMLVGCDNTPTLSSNTKNSSIFEETTNLENLTVDSYQDLFDSLYATNGVSVAVDQLLLEVAKDVLNSSTNWTSTGEAGKLSINAKLEAKLNKHFNNFYTQSTYQENGLFREIKLVKALREQGYKIEEKTEEAFEEEVTSRVGYDDLRSFLKYDYSDYEAKMKRDFYQELLKEEYILSQKATGSYFTNKKVRKVEYFTFTPDTSTVADKYSASLDEYAVANKETAFKTVVAAEGGLEDQWKVQKLDDLAKDFSIINKKHGEINTNLPTYFQEKVQASEEKWQAEEKYAYRDIYDPVTKLSFDSEEIQEVKDKLNSYSSNGTKSIYDGYFEKQLEILTANYYTEKVTTSDHSDLISSTVQDAIEELSEHQYEGYVDPLNSSSAVFKYSSNYYVLKATPITDDSSIEDKYLAAESLATIASNVKNCYFYYLTELTNSGKLSIHNQDVYDYLETTYGYGEQD